MKNGIMMALFLIASNFNLAAMAAEATASPSKTGGAITLIVVVLAFVIVIKLLEKHETGTK